MSVQPLDENDDMHSYFNKSVSAVQAHADHFEQEYGRPALRTSQEFFEERPIAATFVAIFILLSFVPTAFFLGLSLFAVLSIGTLALVVVVFTSATVVLTFLALLVLTLVMTFISAVFLTLFGISLYSFACLLSFVRKHGSSGISEWISYMSEFLLGNVPFQEDSAAFMNGRDGEWSESEVPPQHEVAPKHEENSPLPVVEPPQQTLSSEDKDMFN